MELSNAVQSILSSCILFMASVMDIMSCLSLLFCLQNRRKLTLNSSGFVTQLCSDRGLTFKPKIVQFTLNWLCWNACGGERFKESVWAKNTRRKKTRKMAVIILWSVVLGDERCCLFADYVSDNYVVSYSKFPPILLAVTISRFKAHDKRGRIFPCAL